MHALLRGKRARQQHHPPMETGVYCGSHLWRIWLCLWLCTVVLAVVGAAVHPRGVRWVDPWADALQRLPPLGAVQWIDARARAAYDAGHVPGALWLHPAEWDAGWGEVLAHWNPDLPSWIYCDGAGCPLAQDSAERLTLEWGAHITVQVMDIPAEVLIEHYRGKP